MVSEPRERPVYLALCLILGSTTLVLCFWTFLTGLWSAWTQSPEFSHGLLVPPIVFYLLWLRRRELLDQPNEGSFTGLAIVGTGCALHILASFSGTLLLSGIGLTLTIAGAALYLRGRNCFRVAVAPIALLILMVPLPSYVLGELSWRLQATASTLSSIILRSLGVPVYQDGNILNIATYVLEVKQACSGSRSVFALLALALVIGLTAERRWWARILLVMAAPVLAIVTNVVRIVGTGLVARQWGNLAANESLHATWGVLVFIMAVGGLLGLQRFLRWTTHEYA